MFSKARTNMFGLQSLLQITAKLNCFSASGLKPIEGFCRIDDLLHLGFDPGEIFFADRSRQIEVVIKSIAGRRTKCQAHTGKQPHNRPSHHMRAAVSHHAQRFCITFGDQLERHRTQIREHSQWPHGIHHRAINTGRDRRPGQTLPDTSSDVQSRCRILMFENSPVRQLNLDH